MCEVFNKQCNWNVFCLQTILATGQQNGEGPT